MVIARQSMMEEFVEVTGAAIVTRGRGEAVRRAAFAGMGRGSRVRQRRIADFWEVSTAGCRQPERGAGSGGKGAARELGNHRRRCGVNRISQQLLGSRKKLGTTGDDEEVNVRLS